MVQKPAKGRISEIYAQAKQAFTPEDIALCTSYHLAGYRKKAFSRRRSAEIAIRAGAAGISGFPNHGGRQLDSGPPHSICFPRLQKLSTSECLLFLTAEYAVVRTYSKR